MKFESKRLHVLPGKCIRKCRQQKCRTFCFLSGTHQKTPQHTPPIIHMRALCCALLWLVWPCPSGLLQWCHGNHTSVGEATLKHYSNVIMGLFRGRSNKSQSSASLDFVRGIHRWPVNSPHKGPVTRKMFPFDDVIMRICRNKLNKSVNKHTTVIKQSKSESGAQCIGHAKNCKKKLLIVFKCMDYFYVSRHIDLFIKPFLFLSV